MCSPRLVVTEEKQRTAEWVECGMTKVGRGNGKPTPGGVKGVEESMATGLVGSRVGVYVFFPQLLRAGRQMGGVGANRGVNVCVDRGPRGKATGGDWRVSVDHYGGCVEVYRWDLGVLRWELAGSLSTPRPSWPHKGQRSARAGQRRLQSGLQRYVPACRREENQSTPTGTS
jgi:hypothetical protein